MNRGTAKQRPADTLLFHIKRNKTTLQLRLTNQSVIIHGLKQEQQKSKQQLSFEFLCSLESGTFKHI